VIARFERWLDAAADQQTAVYNHVPSAMTDEQWAGYVQRNLHQAHVELGEVAQELPLRPWRGPVGRPDAEARQRAIVETVDALCFISNYLFALGVTDEELNEAYAKKVRYTTERDGGA